MPNQYIETIGPIGIGGGGGGGGGIGTIVGTAALNRVAYGDAVNSITSDASFTYDGTTLGVRLAIRGNQASSAAGRVIYSQVLNSGSQLFSGGNAATSGASVECFGGEGSSAGLTVFRYASSTLLTATSAGRLFAGKDFAHIALNFHQWAPGLSGPDQYGFNMHPVFAAGSTGSGECIACRPELAPGSYTMARASNFQAAAPTVGSGATLTRWAGYQAEPNTASATNNALYTDSYSTFSGNYGLYLLNASFAHYLGSRLGLGRLPYGNTILSLGNGSISDGGNQTAYVAYAETAFASAFTLAGYGYVADITTAAASFNQQLHAKFYAPNTAKGSGSSMGRQIAYLADPPTQATTGVAILADNTSFGGGWFINQLGTQPSTLGGPLTVNGQLIARGTTGTDSAAAGFIGEYASTAVASFVNAPGATTEWADMINMTLGAGDWDVALVTSLSLNGATMTTFDIGISQTSGNSATGLAEGDNWVPSAQVPTGTIHHGISIPAVRRSLSTSTRIYAKLNATYSAGNPQYVCRMSARRVR